MCQKSGTQSNETRGTQNSVRRLFISSRDKPNNLSKQHPATATPVEYDHFSLSRNRDPFKRRLHKSTPKPQQTPSGTPRPRPKPHLKSSTAPRRVRPISFFYTPRLSSTSPSSLKDALFGSDSEAEEGNAMVPPTPSDTDGGSTTTRSGGMAFNHSY